MILKRGEIVLVRWTDSTLTLGKHRPALVVQADGLNTGLSQVVVAMITTNRSRVGERFRVSIPRRPAAGRGGTGLTVDSVVMADNLATVHFREIDRTIGHVADMTPVDAALRLALGL